ncbi:ABC transporter substrate-binding protein [Aureimonas endophytica]|uniref:ABC transporter substrate-binding protein n=1 Tax=Aureimonas endophytica TaxID=2027858 RepID=A0A916ZS46_9HYPH|nr:extracellular solute-binding protein [Aureimonas endophytica]GGE09754.1 ABC transporter substrate-binding protein [Aureimonas endophytica]
MTIHRPSRRHVLLAGASLALAPRLGFAEEAAPAATEAAPIQPAAPAAAATRDWRIGLGLIEAPKYQPGFLHFDYVDPAAPKGGQLRLQSIGSFDTLNPILSKGDPAEGIGLVFDTLMKASEDESSTEYGLLADGVSYPADYSSVTYRLHPKARWHDGQPVTGEDVVWSFEQLKELNPSQGFYYRHVASAAVTGEREVTFTFDEKNNRELPNIVGQLIVLPKHWWTGKDASGRQRSVAETTLEPPLGSGPYRIAAVSAGRGVTYERVKDYWGADLPVNVGQNNFDRIDYTYFRDDSVAFEAFKANQFDFWSENKASRWATGYDFPAVKDGFVKQERYPNPYRTAGLMVGFAPNLRRPLFQDLRVRRALNLAFDFETMQRTLFFGEYRRPNSFFFNTDLASSGLPGPAELAFLEPLKGKIPDSVFTTPYENPVGGDNAKIRDNLRAALQLLKEAGWEQRGGRLVNSADGQPFAFELLLNGDTLTGVAGQYQQSLKRIGIEMALRPVDPSQYINRIRGRDYDMIYTGLAQSLSPGNEQYDFWSSSAADKPASQNYAGIKDPAVDQLVVDVVQAKDRETLIAATKALDRVLLANQYMIPSYVASDVRVAIWDRFSHPAELPKYSIGWPALWWWDEAKAAKLPAPRT